MARLGVVQQPDDSPSSLCRLEYTVRVIGVEAIRGDREIDREAGAFEAAADAVVGQRGADGELLAVERAERAGPAAATARLLADDLDVQEPLQAQQGVFAGRVGQRVRQETDAAGQEV